MNKFKIGDEVEVVKLNDKVDYSSTKDCIGKIGKVIHIDKKGNPHHVCLAINGEELWFYFNELKPLTPTPFTKNDLRDGDKCIDRDGTEYIVWKNRLVYITEENKIGEYDLLNDDLTNADNSKNYDIMQVIRNGEVVFKREESLNFYMKYHYCSSGKITEDVKQFLKKHDVENKIIEVRIEEVKSCNTN